MEYRERDLEYGKYIPNPVILTQSKTTKRIVSLLCEGECNNFPLDQIQIIPGTLGNTSILGERNQRIKFTHDEHILAEASLSYTEEKGTLISIKTYNMHFTIHQSSDPARSELEWFQEINQHQIQEFLRTQEHINQVYGHGTIKGLGTHIMRQIIDHVNNLGYPEIFIESTPSAVGFYNKILPAFKRQKIIHSFKKETIKNKYAKNYDYTIKIKKQ